MASPSAVSPVGIWKSKVSSGVERRRSSALSWKSSARSSNDDSGEGGTTSNEETGSETRLQRRGSHWMNPFWNSTQRSPGVDRKAHKTATDLFNESFDFRKNSFVNMGDESDFVASVMLSPRFWRWQVGMTVLIWVVVCERVRMRLSHGDEIHDATTMIVISGAGLLTLAAICIAFVRIRPTWKVAYVHVVWLTFSIFLAETSRGWSAVAVLVAAIGVGSLPDNQPLNIRRHRLVLPLLALCAFALTCSLTSTCKGESLASSSNTTSTRSEVHFGPIEVCLIVGLLVVCLSSSSYERALRIVFVAEKQLLMHHNSNKSLSSRIISQHMELKNSHRIISIKNATIKQSRRSLAKAQEAVDQVMKEGGTLLGNFRIRYSEIHLDDEVLGEGTFGTVSKGTFRGRPVAVKKLRMEKICKDRMEKFRSEIICMAPLRHKNLVFFVGACWDDGAYFCLQASPKVLTFVVENLQVQTNCALCSSSAKMERLQYCWAWSHVRGKHRDISSFLESLDVCNTCITCLGVRWLTATHVVKPENILLSDDFCIAKLADFGESKMMARDHSDDANTWAVAMTVDTNVGTKMYAAPELVKNEKANESVDIYALGMTILETVIGDLKTVRDAFQAYATKSGANDGRWCPTVPEELFTSMPKITQIIEECLSPEFAQRPAAIEVMLRLESLVEEVHVENDDSILNGLYTFEPDKESSLLGEGNFGQVYRMKSKSDGRFVAMKRLSTSQIGSESAMNSIKEEVRMMAIVDSIFVVKLYVSCFSVKSCFIVMELVKGTEFKRVVQMRRKCNEEDALSNEPLGPFAAETILMWCAQLASALDHLDRACGIVHRDLHNGNIMVDCMTSVPGVKVLDHRRGENYRYDDISLSHTRLKILDLGLSTFKARSGRKYAASTASNEPRRISILTRKRRVSYVSTIEEYAGFKGTRAPETYQKDDNGTITYDSRVDVWSLGIWLIEAFELKTIEEWYLDEDSEIDAIRKMKSFGTDRSLHEDKLKQIEKSAGGPEFLTILKRALCWDRFRRAHANEIREIANENLKKYQHHTIYS